MTGAGVGAEGLAELVGHYAREVAIAPSAAVYDELTSARSFAGMLLGRMAARRRPELTVTAGWLTRAQRRRQMPCSLLAKKAFPGPVRRPPSQPDRAGPRRSQS